MNRFHVHVSVADLQRSIAFYSRLFDAAPCVVETDYAKWMLEDPRINFAISRRGENRRAGVNHLGLQVDSEPELEALEARFSAAGLSAVPERSAACCYARADKSWVRDPDGVVWEHFHTLDRIPAFGDDGPHLLQEPSAGLARAACCG